MELKIERLWKTDVSTVGTLTVDGVFECYTLEDAVREHKIHGKTAINAGRYEVVITMSARFKRLMPLLLNVPNFAGVRIHSGNTHKDTEGCVLVGSSRAVNFVGGSRLAFEKLLPKIEAGLKLGKVWLEIE